MSKRVTATSAKNRFGEILRMAEDEPVYIIKHGKPRTVIVNADHYEALAHGRQSRQDEVLAELRKEFRDMVEQMQTPTWRKGVDRLLSASAEELTQTASAQIRSRGKKHR